MKEGQPIEFSVVIAVFNGEKTLARAIDSVLSQTYPAREVIVVDDGSTDASAAVAERYGSKVKLIRQSNRGVSAARNLGVEAASSPWIAFLDADDFYYSQRLALAADLIRRSPNVDFVTANFDYVDPDGQLLRRSLESTALGKRLIQQNQTPFVWLGREEFGEFIEDHFGDTHTLTVPRRTFLDLGGYPRDFAVCEDVHWLIRLCAASNCAGVILEPVAAYVIHSQSATRSDPLRAQRQTVAAWESLAPQLEGAARPLRRGYRRGLLRARYNLAVALLREGFRLEAVKAMLPSLYEYPSWESVKKTLAVAKG